MMVWENTKGLSEIILLVAMVILCVALESYSLLKSIIRG